MRELIGKRIQVVQGMKEKGHENHLIWNAGTIPVGAIGTVVEDTTKFKTPVLKIVWEDEKYEAKNDYIYMITEDSCFFDILD